MPKIFQRGKKGIFSVRIYSGGRERWISLRTPHRREAERRAGKLLYCELPAPLKAAVEKPKTTLAYLWECYLRSHQYAQLKPSTALDKSRCFAEFCQFSKKEFADDVTPRLCAKYLAREIKLRSPETARHKRTQVGSVWAAMAVPMELPNPWHDLPRISTEPGATRHTTPFTDAQVTAILEAAKGKPFEGVILISLHTGARLKDAVHMRHEYLKDGVLSFLPQKTARKGRPVRLPVHPDIMCFFSPGGTGYLFPGEVARYAHSSVAQVNNFRDLLKRLGIKGEGQARLSFHSLRSTFITRAEAAGIERRRIQAAVGHVNESQTAAYSEVAMTAEDVARILAKP